MSKYFCVVYDDRDFVAKVKDESVYYSGYQEAGNWDLALTAFMKNLGLDRNHPNIRSSVPEVDTIRVDRLEESLWESQPFDPWDCGFRLDMVTSWFEIEDRILAAITYDEAEQLQASQAALKRVGGIQNVRAAICNAVHESKKRAK